MTWHIFLQDNQEREKKKHAKLKSSRDAERETNKELMKDGKKPVFVSKAERKAKELVKFLNKIWTLNGQLDVKLILAHFLILFNVFKDLLPHKTFKLEIFFAFNDCMRCLEYL